MRSLLKADFLFWKVKTRRLKFKKKIIGNDHLWIHNLRSPNTFIDHFRFSSRNNLGEYISYSRLISFVSFCCFSGEYSKLTFCQKRKCCRLLRIIHWTIDSNYIFYTCILPDHILDITYHIFFFSRAGE